MHGFNPNKSKRLIEERINSIGLSINFADYDGNGGGVVNGIFVVYVEQRPDTKKSK